MSQHDFSVANASGAAVRADLNSALQALVGLSSGTTDPATAIGTTYPFQFWMDTTTGLLKIRNAANNAWITIGDPSLTNLGMLTLAGGGTIAAAVLFSNTDYLKIPNGTTAQRPGSPATGMIRYNSSLGVPEVYFNSAWWPFGKTAFGKGGTETVTSATRTLTAADDGMVFLVDTTSNAISFQLPTTKADFKFTIKDKVGNFDTNACTITRAAAETVEGYAANLVLNAKFGKWSFISDSSYNYWIVG